jgi:hypothetical protein
LPGNSKKMPNNLVSGIRREKGKIARKTVVNLNKLGGKRRENVSDQMGSIVKTIILFDLPNVEGK